MLRIMEVVWVAFVGVAGTLLAPFVQYFLQNQRDRRIDRRHQADAVKKGVSRLNDAHTRFIEVIADMPKSNVICVDGVRGTIADKENLLCRQREHCQRAFITFSNEVKSAFIEMSFGVSDSVIREKFQITWEHWKAVLDELNPATFESLDFYEGVVDRLSYAELDAGLVRFVFDTQTRLIIGRNKHRSDHS